MLKTPEYSRGGGNVSERPKYIPVVLLHSSRLSHLSADRRSQSTDQLILFVDNDDDQRRKIISISLLSFFSFHLRMILTFQHCHLEPTSQILEQHSCATLNKRTGCSKYIFQVQNSYGTIKLVNVITSRCWNNKYPKFSKKQPQRLHKESYSVQSSLKVTKYLGNFCLKICSQDLSKIAKYGPIAFHQHKTAQ